MWKLSIADDQGQRTTVNLARDEYTIGRADGNAIRLTERNVSRLHAVIRRSKDGFVLEDLASENGTFANGVRVAKLQELAHGDLLQIGDYRLEMIDEELSTQEQAHRPLVSQALTNPGHLPDRLVVLIGPRQGYEFSLEGERHLIGRGEECDFSIDHASVSRVHAEVRRIDANHFEVLDKGSSNGLRVNSRDMPRAMLDNGDVIEIGDVILKFVAEGQLFRANAQESGQLLVLGARESSAPPETPVTGAGRRIVAALVGAIVAVALTAYVLSGTRSTGSSAPTKPRAAAGWDEPLPEAVESSLLEAERLEKSGSIAEAHALVRKLVDRPRFPSHHPRLAAIEAGWARHQLDLAAATDDVREKKSLLDEVARTETVPPILRQEASRLLDKAQTSSISLDDLARDVPPAGGPRADEPTD
jgi:ABC transport system ATP-binding/permease protein